jgi:hypothetical protein
MVYSDYTCPSQLNIAPCPRGQVDYSELGRCSVRFQLLCETYVLLKGYMSILQVFTTLLRRGHQLMRRVSVLRIPHILVHMIMQRKSLNHNHNRYQLGIPQSERVWGGYIREWVFSSYSERRSVDDCACCCLRY